MSRADELFIENCKEILAHGVWDTEQEVRPRWADGAPAHTVKKFGIVNRYDLRAEFPVQTIRKMAFKSAVDELLWIWQKKSNNIHDLSSHIWDAWADESGSIGKAYGYQLGVKHRYPEGEFDQVDRVLYDLKHNPASRRILTSLYNHHDLSEMALYPCAWSVTFNVSGRTLNAVLNQRSQDMLTANGWNVMQYAVLVHFLARASGLRRGSWCTSSPTPTSMTAMCRWWRSSSPGRPTRPQGCGWTRRLPTSTPSRRTASAWRATASTRWSGPSPWRYKEGAR